MSLSGMARLNSQCRIISSSLIFLISVSSPESAGCIQTGGFTAPPTPERSHDELVADAEQKKNSR